MLVPPRQAGQRIEIPADQRFLLGSGPALDLPFRRNGISDVIEMRRVDEGHGPALRRIAPEHSQIMLTDPCLDFRKPRGADVITAIGAMENVEPASVHAKDQISSS